ncbi:MAG TPA: nucleotidyl transferase AbiEii/AbiGii toxin family protein [Burkholderiales bacterium]|nr:nucleotidyl transferase AbiEii/AbiGii toxin family protein [Burkholderiales bacterium]
MTEYTRPATWDDLKQVARYLNQSGVEYALVGGYAIAAHGLNRFTEDIDLLVDPTAENSRRWIAALSHLPDGATRELMDEPDVFSNERRYAVRVNDEFTIDVMPSIAGRSWQEMAPFIERIQLDDVAIPILNLEGLLATKQGARPKDQMDAAAIRAAIEALKGP